MHSAANPLFDAASNDGDDAAAPDRAADARDVQVELDLLKEIVRLLPAAVTVQDEQGRFLLVNDAAAAQLSIPAGGMPAASSAPHAGALARRRDACIEVLRADRAAVGEECFGDGPLKRT